MLGFWRGDLWARSPRFWRGAFSFSRRSGSRRPWGASAALLTGVSCILFYLFVAVCGLWLTMEVAHFTPIRGLPVEWPHSRFRRPSAAPLHRQLQARSDMRFTVTCLWISVAATLGGCTDMRFSVSERDLLPSPSEQILLNALGHHAGGSLIPGILAPLGFAFLVCASNEGVRAIRPNFTYSGRLEMLAGPSPAMTVLLVRRASQWVGRTPPLIRASRLSSNGSSLSNNTVSGRLTFAWTMVFIYPRAGGSRASNSWSYPGLQRPISF